MKLSNYQIKVLSELAKGGKIFMFFPPTEYGFDDSKGNSLTLRKDTFNVLKSNDFIDVKCRPSISCYIYKLSVKGQKYLSEIDKTTIKPNTNFLKLKATYIGPQDYTGFVPTIEYILQITYNQFTKQSTVYAEKENLRAKYGSINSFFLNFDNVSLISE